MPSRILRLWNPNTSAWEEVGDSRLTTHAAAADPHPGYLLESLLDAKGDLVAASAADAPARLAVGTNGQVLTADSAQTLGVRWATPTGGVTSVDGQTGAVDLSATYVNATGDTMTGQLTAPTLAAGTAGGTLSRLFGATTGALSPSAQTGDYELGEQFASSAAGTLTQVRWYRTAAGTATPSQVRLWDTTATGSPVWTAPAGDLTPFADTAVGWKTATVSSPPSLVAGREYVLSYRTGGSYGQFDGYNPVPDSPLTLAVHPHVYNLTPGGFPSSWTAAASYTIDAGVTTGAAGRAASGAVRLPNGSAGQIAWRNAANSADLTLTANSSDRLAYSGTTLMLAGDTAATLARTGAGALRADTNLGVGVAPAAWGSAWRATQIGGNGVLFSDASGGTLFIGTNTYNDGTTNRAIANAGASRLDVGTTTPLVVGTAPAVAAGAAQTFTTRLQVAQNGTVTLTPDAGQAALVATINAGFLQVNAGISAAPNSPRFQSGGGSWIEADPGGNAFVPSRDNAVLLGGTSNRWTTVYAVAGTINTSLAEAKEAITPLDPATAMAAVRATTPVTFDYLAPERGSEWYELPDDPEQAARVLEQRLTAAPLEAGARHQHGVVLDDPTYPCDPAFQTGSGQTNPSSSVGLLLGAIKNLDARLSALGG